MTVNVTYSNGAKNKVLEVIEVDGELPVALLADGESHSSGMTGISSIRLREVDAPVVEAPATPAA